MSQSLKHLRMGFTLYFCFCLMTSFGFYGKTVTGFARQGNALVAPSGLTARQTGSQVILNWQAPDLSRFSTELTTFRQAPVAETEPNNSQTQAQPVFLNSIISGRAEASDSGQYVLALADGSSDDFEDIFKFTLTEAKQVSIKLEYTEEDADLDVWLLANDARLTILDDDGATQDNPELTLVDLDPGTYLIAVSTFEPGPPTPAETSDYRLTISTSDPGTPQLDSFNIYRAESTTVPLTREFLVGNVLADTTQFTDTPRGGDGRTAYSYVVTALYDTGESAASNTVSIVFSTDRTSPTVRVSSPNGGETASAGSPLNITWTATDDIGVSSQEISLSTDGGTTFPTSVATGLSGNTSTFTFPIPTTLRSTSARIRVVARDAAGNEGSDTSDASFTIGGADAVPPTVRLISPNSKSDKLRAGQSFLVQWQSSDNIVLASHDLLLSTDGGATFATTIATGLPGSAQSFSFAVSATQPKSKTARIRVIARDAAGNVAQDDSDENFKIKKAK